MDWYIQQYKDRDGSTQRLIYTIQELGHNICVEEYDKDTNLPLPNDKPVVFHGSIPCALNVKHRNLPFKPFAWFDAVKLSCLHYYSYWDKYLFQKTYGFYPLGVLGNKKEWLFNTYSKDDKIFVRPNDNDKLFTGMLLTKSRIDGWVKLIQAAPDFAEAVVVVSSPEPIEREWRLIIQDGKVITGSRYMDRGVVDTEPEFPDDAAVVAEDACKIWMPHPIFVMDIAKTPDGFKIMECGSINCAGYYDCDLKKIVTAMSQVAEREFNVPKI